MTSKDDLEKSIKERDPSYSNVSPIRQSNSKIQSIDYKEISSIKPKPIEYILYPWLPKQGIAFIYAAAGVGKTLFAMNSAYAICKGGNFLKYKCPMPRKLLYIDGEMSYVQIHNRFMQMIKQQGELEGEDKKNWNLFTPDKVLPFRLPKICDPEGQRFYTELIEKEKYEVLVIDNLSALSWIDENNNQEWKVIQDWIMTLRAKGLSIIIVHHAGKDSKGYRGTSRMLDCVDSAISLQNIVSQNTESESELTSSRKFKIEYQKARTFTGSEAMPFEVTLSNSGWTYESAEKNNTERIREMHFDLGMRPIEIATELGINKTHVCRMIKKFKSTPLYTSKSR